MAISEQQREARKKYIGSSDIASILGLNPWTTAEDVRLAKCGKLEEWQGNEATRAGEYLESAILQWAEDELHTSLQLDTMFIHHNGIMAANVDGTDYEDGEGFVVEAKTSGIVGKPYGDWGTPGTDEVPPMYYVQVQHQLACCGPEYKRGYVAALIGGYGFRMYTLDRDEETIKLIETAAAKFWNEYVLKDRPAPGGLATLEVLRRVRRETGLVVDIDPGGWRDFLEIGRAHV